MFGPSQFANQKKKKSNALSWFCVSGGNKKDYRVQYRSAESVEERRQHKDPDDGSALPERQLTPPLYV